jgi:hypothetical protein
MVNKKLKPSDFMRARRPELFSDTVSFVDNSLSRNQFEFHLDTLTQRKEETRFEHFCRKLAEIELCPNLLPQTGPTGGGDSKVDSETYPVANSISERWYIGDPERASKERWAFAFSAKKQWKRKVQDDVKKIVETGRNYALIFFISNQSISDRNRAKTEDELTRQFKVELRILDRAWIIEKVMNNKRWNIVFHTLDIEASHPERKNHLGFQDAHRLHELEDLDKQIENTDRYQNNDYQLAEDCLQTALLARGLSRPRTEVDGRFDRAERIARKRGDNRQLFNILYNRAWTAYWWFDDFDELQEIYPSAENLILDVEWGWDLEKLVNLWSVSNTCIAIESLDKYAITWAEHSTKLRKALQLHTNKSDKPSSALWSRTQLVLMDFSDAVVHKENLLTPLSNFKAILKEAENYLDFQSGSVIRIIQELGQFIVNNEAFDDLFEIASAFYGKRSSNAAEGELRLNRGFQKLEARKAYEAIEQFTKAQNLLAQEELLDKFVQALVGNALGYEAAGLLWAARANLLLALDRLFSNYLKYRVISPQAFPVLRKLVWIEIQLGRMPCVIIWIEWLLLFSSRIESESERKEFEEEFYLMDAISGILVLRTRHADWLNLDRIPGLFEKFSLFMPRAA